MTKKLTTTPPNGESISAETMEKVLIGADLSGLNPEQSLQYYKSLCDSLQLNPLTRPFEYITLDGKRVLYARKDCTDQIRKRDAITITVKERTLSDGVYFVIVSGISGDKREDEAIGAEGMVEPDWIKEWSNTERKKVWVANKLAGKPLPAADRAICMMKAETKAKRRVTLSLGGLGMVDESEIDDAMRREVPAIIAADAQAIEDEKAARLAEHTAKAGTTETKPDGSTVTYIAPEPPPQLNARWQDLVIHVGKANGPMLGHKLGEVPGAVLEWLAEKWKPKANAKDAALAEAVKQAIAGKKEPESAPETPKEVSAPPPEPEKPVAAAKNEETTPSMEWRIIKTHSIGAKLSGRTLGECADSKLGELVKSPSPLDGNAILRRLAGEAGIGMISGGKESDHSKQELIAGIKCAVAEMKPFDDPAWLTSLDIDGLRAEVSRRIEEMGVSSGDADEKLSKDGEPVDIAPEKMLRYYLDNWPVIAEVIGGTE